MPPIFGSIIFINAANFISSCPMIALKGYTGLAVSSTLTSGTQFLSE
jgi:hypothetical protein